VGHASSGKCQEICDDYARRDSRIKIIHKIKGSPSVARNQALKVVRGDYVYFIDGGDYVVNTLIEVALMNAVASSADLLVFNYNKVDEYDNLLSPVRFSTVIYELEEHNRLKYIINTLDQYKSGWEVGNRLFKTEIIIKNKLFFWDNNLISAVDLGFSLNYSLYVSKISYIADVLYNYRVKKDSVRAQSQKEPRISEAIELCKILEEKLKPMKIETKIKKKYLILLFGLINEQVAKLNAYNYKNLLSSFEDKEFFYSIIRKVSLKPLLLIKYYGFIKAIALLLQCIFLSSRRVKKVGIFVIHMINKCQKVSETFQYNKGKIFSKKRIFLVGCEDFWNLGDHHIAISEIEYLEEIFPEYAIVEITASQYFAVNRLLPFVIRRKNLICLHGGGNMGNFYMLAEYIRRDIMKKFINNEKVIFPQTIHYDDSNEANVELIKDQGLIKKTRNLTLCIREQYSYELAKQYFDCDIVLKPDMVLFSNYSDKLVFDREGVILLLRNDLEGVISEKDKQLIKNIVEKYSQEVRINDTQLIIDININDRREVMDDFISKVAGAELVITDRLHGMVFCAITKTPCIVLPNYNHKVEGVYDWISKLEYIIMIKYMTELEDAINRLRKIQRLIYENSKLQDEFDSLTKMLMSKVK
jgi:pyruvyl transferase EpsI